MRTRATLVVLGVSCMLGCALDYSGLPGSPPEDDGPTVPGEMPATEMPGAEMPGEETPGEETPGEETPEETPAEEPPPPMEGCTPGEVIGEAFVTGWCSGTFCSAPCEECRDATGAARCEPAWYDSDWGECPPRTSAHCPDETTHREEIVMEDWDRWTTHHRCLRRCDSRRR